VRMKSEEVTEVSICRDEVFGVISQESKTCEEEGTRGKY
jgi:hypothetical protein